jgi:HSP20 family molecular chaperone IbpA
MGTAEKGVVYAMTLSFGKDGNGPKGEPWSPPIEMNRWLRPGGPGGSAAAGRHYRVETPPVDVRIGIDEIFLVADLPGVPRDRIDIRVLPRYIEIVGMPADEAPAAPGAIQFKDGADMAAVRNNRPQSGGAPGGARARLRDGILELRVPRSAILSGNGSGPVPVR